MAIAPAIQKDLIIAASYGIESFYLATFPMRSGCKSLSQECPRLTLASKGRRPTTRHIPIQRFIEAVATLRSMDSLMEGSFRSTKMACWATACNGYEDEHGFHI